MALYIHVEQSPTGRRLIATGRFTQYTGQRLTTGDVIFTWGSDLVGTRYQLNGAIYLNHTLHYDKLDQGTLILRANLPLPKLYRNNEEWMADGYPALIKKPRNGQGGRGVVLCDRTTRPGWRYENIYQRFINKTREFRAQQIGNLTAYCMEKFRPEGGGVCWNLDRGSEWHMLSSRDTGLNSRLNTLATQTLTAIGYNFGAVDIMADQEGQLWILECNSRPGLGRENINLFADTMVRYYNNLVRNPR